MKTSIAWPRKVRHFIHTGIKTGYNKGWFLVDEPDKSGLATFQRKGVPTLIQVSVYDFLNDEEDFWIKFDKAIKQTQKQTQHAENLENKKVKIVGWKIPSDEPFEDGPHFRRPSYRLTHLDKKGVEHYVCHIGMQYPSKELIVVREDGKDFAFDSMVLAPVIGGDIRTLFSVTCAKCSTVVHAITDENHDLHAINGKIEDLMPPESVNA